MAEPTAKVRYPSNPQHWLDHRHEIEQLYDQNKLDVVMRYMEQRHNFRATVKQWKTQLKKWGLKKRIEGYEYKAILKLKRNRENERSGIGSDFYLRGEIVPPEKIARFHEDALKKGQITEDDTFSQIATPPTLSCRTPPLGNFDWWESFADFSVFEPPAILKGYEAMPIRISLAPLGKKLDTYEDHRLFGDMVYKSRELFSCPGCTLDDLISPLTIAHYDGPIMRESYIGAIIQGLKEWEELEHYQIFRIAGLIASILWSIGSCVKALKVMSESSEHVDDSLSHNDLAVFRVRLASFHICLGQIQNAAEQLCKAFGPEYGRLAIVEDWSRSQSGQIRAIGPAPIPRLEELSFDLTDSRWNFNFGILEDEPVDIEIPAGTLCLPHEIISSSVPDGGDSTLFSTLFFSTVKIRRRDLRLLTFAAKLVREVHQRSAASVKGFTIASCDEDSQDHV